MFEITKEFKFEMSHVLSNYNGPCGNLHGHSYRCLMSFTSEKLGDFNQESMVIDFNDVKKIAGTLIDSLDHCFAYNSNTTDNFEIELINLCHKYHKKTFAFPTRTTAEEMSKFIYTFINDQLKLMDTSVKCSKVQLFETVTGNCVYGG